MTPYISNVYTDGKPTSNSAIEDIDTIYNTTPIQKVPDHIKTASPNTLPDGVVAATEKAYTGKISIILNDGIFPYLLPDQKKQVLIHELTHVEEMAKNKLSNLIELEKLHKYTWDNRVDKFKNKILINYIGKDLT